MCPKEIGVDVIAEMNRLHVKATFTRREEPGEAEQYFAVGTLLSTPSFRQLVRDGANPVFLPT